MAEPGHTEADAQTVEAEAPLTVADFLESTPPGQLREVTESYAMTVPERGNWYYEIAVPQIQLHCPNEECGGPRFFRYFAGERALRQTERIKRTYLTYVCWN